MASAALVLESIARAKKNPDFYLLNNKLNDFFWSIRQNSKKKVFENNKRNDKTALDDNYNIWQEGSPNVLFIGMTSQCKICDNVLVR